jgi:hypothetical protein
LKNKLLPGGNNNNPKKKKKKKNQRKNCAQIQEGNNYKQTKICFLGEKSLKSFKSRKSNKNKHRTPPLFFQRKKSQVF